MELTEEVKQRIMGLRDEELYHRRRAEELRRELQDMVASVGNVQIAVLPVEPEKGDGSGKG